MSKEVIFSYKFELEGQGSISFDIRLFREKADRLINVEKDIEGQEHFVIASPTHITIWGEVLSELEEGDFNISMLPVDIRKSVTMFSSFKGHSTIPAQEMIPIKVRNLSIERNGQVVLIQGFFDYEEETKPQEGTIDE